jgi:hypothetical protein
MECSHTKGVKGKRRKIDVRKTRVGFINICRRDGSVSCAICCSHVVNCEDYSLLGVDFLAAYRVAHRR